jgi:predicted nucleic acid-binding protein
VIVVDASVAVKWFVAEPDSVQAATIFAADRTLLAPEHALGEIGEVLVRLDRRGEIGREQLSAATRRVLWRLALTAASPMFLRATTIASDASVSVYDALYVAAAERWTIPLVTADARLAAALAATPWRTRVTLLRDWRDPGEP